MHFVQKLATLVFTVLTISPLAQAIQLSGSVQAVGNGIVAGREVQRGGTVEAVDMRSKTITVDGVQYSMPDKSQVVHQSTTNLSGGTSPLRVGTKIRFNTSKHNYANKDQVTDIWIVSQPKGPIESKAIRNTPGRNKPGNP